MGGWVGECVIGWLVGRVVESLFCVWVGVGGRESSSSSHLYLCVRGGHQNKGLLVGLACSSSSSLLILLLVI